MTDRMLFPDEPLSYMNDPAAFFRWRREIGADEAGRQLTEATRAYTWRSTAPAPPSM